MVKFNKIFNFMSFKKKTSNILDYDIVRSNFSLTNATKSKTDIIKSVIKKVSFSIFNNGGADEFETPHIELSIFKDAYNTDGYIRQANDKYVDQLFKEGYQFFGKNPEAVLYIKKRFDFMAEVTNMPTQEFFIGLAEDIVKYSNVFLIKTRSSKPEHQHPELDVTGYYENDPIAGYFFVDATTVNLKRDKNGILKTLVQTTEDEEKEFAAKKIIHFYYKKEKGEAFGRPFMTPVLDDVRALRQIEQDVLRMVHKNINPFMHIKVGSKDIPGQESDVTDMKQNIENMEVDGGLITTERVEIIPIASEKVLDTAPILKYLEQRIFTGTGIPAIMFGRGDTANRSTGDSMTSEMSDRIKAIQTSIESGVYHFIIKELLLEGGFDPLVDPLNKVEFKFNENDLDSKVKKENHTTFLFEHNIITEDEARNDIGRDPIEDSMREKLFSNLYGKVDNGETDNKNDPKSNTPSKSSKTKDSTAITKHSLYNILSESVENINNEKKSKNIIQGIKNVVYKSLEDTTSGNINLDYVLNLFYEEYIRTNNDETVIEVYSSVIFKKIN